MEGCPGERCWGGAEEEGTGRTNNRCARDHLKCLGRGSQEAQEKGQGRTNCTSAQRNHAFFSCWFRTGHWPPRSVFATCHWNPLAPPAGVLLQRPTQVPYSL